MQISHPEWSNYPPGLTTFAWLSWLLLCCQVDCKEFLRVMQLNSAHLCGGVSGEEIQEQDDNSAADRED